MSIDEILRKNGDYPELLREISDTPEKIYVRGKVGNEPKIAIVGTRGASQRGKEIARELAVYLSAAGVTVVSGLAMGIDTAAHAGALENKGVTIAVLANGLDWVYPKQNENLAKKILENGGALISEYPVGAETYPSNFLARNRIISGLSRGVIIVEAPEKSGALATAHFAAEQNREVYVVPGPMKDPHYAGSHALIKEGARLITGPEEILADLGLSGGQKTLSSEIFSGLEKEIAGVLQKSGAPVSVDKIHEMTKIDVSEINRVLTGLLIRGMIKEERGRYSLS